MTNPLSKTPFLFLLIPLILGIILQYYACNITWSTVFFLTGGILALLSFWVKKEHTYSYRWLFGSATIFLFVALGGTTTYVKQSSVDYVLSDSTRTYIGYITETPQEKPRSIAHKIHLEQENIDVVCYLQKDSTKLPLQVGDEIMFAVQLQPFKNAGNPDDFDYQKYMHNQGFVGTAYLSTASWIKTDRVHKSLKTTALQVRQRIMNFYSQLGFSGDEHAMLSALTLGYQDTLSDDLKQAFRTTGTVHVLSVSGLHVGVIYAMIAFLLSFIPRTSRFYKARLILILILLWAYAFITGLPTSVVRASVMLSVYCVGDFLNKKNYSLNGLFIAAFLMLVYNPFWLFDIGFQLSCVSVLSILILYPKMVKLRKVKNNFSRYIWQMFCISIVAQLATFPLCLYYFGTFPTYFFVANLIIVPLVSFVIYTIGLVLLAWIAASLVPLFSQYVYWLPLKIVHCLVATLRWVVDLFETLPFALIENLNLTFLQLLVLISIIVFMLIATMRSSSKALILSLISLVLFLTIPITERLKAKENRLTVFNRNGYTDIIVEQQGVKFSLDSLMTNSKNPVTEIGGKKVLIINTPINEKMLTKETYPLDYLIFTGNQNYYALASILKLYNSPIIVLDGSLNSLTRRQLTKECENKNIRVHDVTKNGAFSFIF